MGTSQKENPAGGPGRWGTSRDHFTATRSTGQGLDAARVRSAAQGHWREILTNLGMAPAFLTNRHGPCPNCGGKDRFRFDDKADNGTWICSQCGSGDGFTLAGKLLWLDPKADFGEILERVADVLGIGPDPTSDPRPPRSAPRPGVRHDEPHGYDGPGGADRHPDSESPRHDPASIWAACEPAPADHPYLVRKGIQAHGLRLYRGGATIARTPLDNALVMPLRGPDGQLRTLQFITQSGMKLLLSGHAKKGSFFVVGEMTNTICIVEGFATGASVHEAGGHQTIVAVDAGNLLPVAESIRAAYPEKTIILCADDDAHTPGNPGMSKATTAARAIGGLLAVPNFGENRPEGATDFNDLMRLHGLKAVRLDIEVAEPVGPEAETPEVEEVQKFSLSNRLVSLTICDALANPIFIVDRWIPRGEVVLSDCGLHRHWTPFWIIDDKSDQGVVHLS
ncbi:MAG: toprim domain-containing protein [Magnetococcus sp. YQC-9]